MRKRWRLIPFGLLAVIIAAIALWPRSPDKFDVLRKFHPEETLWTSRLVGPPPGPVVWQRKFQFKKMTPELCSVLGITREDTVPNHSFLIFRFKGQLASFDSGRKEVIFNNQPALPWLELQILSLKQRLGW